MTNVFKLLNNSNIKFYYYDHKSKLLSDKFNIFNIFDLDHYNNDFYRFVVYNKKLVGIIYLKYNNNCFEIKDFHIFDDIVKEYELYSYKELNIHPLVQLFFNNPNEFFNQLINSEDKKLYIQEILYFIKPIYPYIELEGFDSLMTPYIIKFIKLNKIIKFDVFYNLISIENMLK